MRILTRNLNEFDIYFDYSFIIVRAHHRVATAEWKFATNATDYNRRRMKEQQNLASKFECLSWRRASRFDATRILEPNIRRQLGRILEQGKCGLGDDKYLEVSLKLE
jgi:peptidyl-dipeptidase A